MAIDTPVSQRADQFSTTLVATLNGNPVFSQTFSAPFGDPTVQAAVLLADAILTGDGASFGGPGLASGSTNLLGGQLSYVQAGEGTPAAPFGPVAASGLCVTLAGFIRCTDPTPTSTFGPAWIQGCVAGPGNVCPDPGADFTFVLAGQLDVNIPSVDEFAIDRNVVTTSTYLTTQTYDILATTTSATPEPSSLELAGICLAVLALAGVRKRLAQIR